MKKLIAIAFILILTAILQIRGDEIPSIVYVDDDFNVDTPGWNVTKFNEIQSAIEKVAYNGTVIVYDGIYDGFEINKKVNVTGKNNVLINARNKNIVIGANGSIIKNLKIIRSKSYAIELNASFCKIENCEIMNNLFGIIIKGKKNTITNNVFISNGIFIKGNNINDYIQNISNNTINGRQIIYLINESNFLLNGFGEAILINCNNFSVENVSSSNVDNSLFLFSCKNSSIRNCYFTNNSIAIYLISSRNIKISKCFFLNNTVGINISSSNENKILKCEFIDNEYGIFSNGTENLIYLNNFINDINAYDKGYNFWNNATMGNYWNDYDGNDSNNDGIGDEPYHIMGGISIDNFPLMQPYDFIPPYTKVILNATLGNNGWYRSDVKISLIAIDNETGINETKYRIDGGNWSIYDKPFFVGEGIHEIEYFSIDLYGNEEKIKKIDLKVDKSAPSIYYSITPSMPDGKNGWYVSNVGISLNAGDENGVEELSYKINDGNWEDYTGFFVIAVEGNFTIYFRAIDVAGNEKIENITLKIDKEEPVIEIENISKYVKQYYEIKWNVHDNVDEKIDRVSIFYSKDNITWVEIVVNISNDGIYLWNTLGFEDSDESYIKIEAEDDAGNIGMAISNKFTLDNTPPTVLIKQPIEGKSYGIDEYGNLIIDIEWEAYDSVDKNLDGNITIEYYDGKNWNILVENFNNIGSYSYNAKEWEDGNYKIRIKATDDAGNVGMAISPNFTIDKKPPAVEIIKPSKGYLYINLFGRDIIPPIPLVGIPYDAIIIGKIRVEIKASDEHSGIQRIEIFTGNATYYIYSPPYYWEWNPKFGINRLKATAYDNAGNSKSYEIENILCINA